MGTEYQISKNDCIKILQKHIQTKNLELIDFEEKSVNGQVVGIMSSHYKLKTKTKLNNKIISNSFFVKRMQSQYTIQTEFIKEQGAYEKENFAYGILSQLYETDDYVCDYMAKCYLAVEDELFVFQDISEDGYLVNKCKNDVLDLHHLKLTLDKTAKFHAGSIIYEDKKSAKLGKRYRMIDDYSKYFKDPMYRKNEEFLGEKFFRICVKTVLDLIDIVPYFKDNKIEIKNKFLEQVDRVYDLVKPSEEFCNVICHGDLWNSNLLFKYDKNDKATHCKIIDFQALRYTVPAHDYSYIIHSNCINTDNEYLSRYYYNSLQKYLSESDVDINKYMTYNQFLASIDYIYPFVVVQNACFASLCILRLSEESEKYFSKYLYEDRSDWCIQAYKNDELFRNIIDGAMKDLNKL